ncbi:hypothetical protein Moror_4058 [Moniliophthora roreri MCA 2997]|uniref:Uncharacterized protein n=1 Tax=Moniliophthora roreri (strain MCA 2997) TaxID=1381753 RepID=V2XD81_MONRO|nr:hypothetical protein Moror_4058 [Moniliophthora roreri MCA 2997]
MMQDETSTNPFTKHPESSAGEIQQDPEVGSSRRRRFLNAFKRAEDRASEATAASDRSSAQQKKGPEVRSMIREFAETSEVLMNVLDEVQKLHPCIGVAVIAFKTVISLELKRRDNDDKVMALLLKIQEMMKVLVQLRAISPEQKAHDQSFTVQEKIASLCIQIEEDIKACGNFCDAYSKKGILARIIKSPLYEIRLAEFGDTFEERQRELQLALNIFTAQEARFTNEALSAMNDSLKSTHDKLDMLVVFRSLQSPFEKEVWEFVRAKGGLAKVMEDDTVTARLLQMLSRIPSDSSTAQQTPWSGPRSGIHAPRHGPVELPADSWPSAGTPYRAPGSHMTPMSHIPAIPDNRSHYTPMWQASSMPTTGTPQRPSVHGFSNYTPWAAATPLPAANMSSVRQSPWHSATLLFPPQPMATPGGVPGALPSHPVNTPLGGYGTLPAVRMHSSHYRSGQEPSAVQMSNTPGAFWSQISQLRKELEEDIDEEVKTNLVVYLRKFNAQQRQLLAQLERAIVRQGDRVVQAVNEGPHDRIYDKELRQVWKDMGWRLLVPTTEFVLTLHDYFVSQHRDMQIFDVHFSRPPPRGSTTADVKLALTEAIAAAKKRTEDKWALKSLTVTNLQPIQEVFDADVSGYVSVWEANQVCSLRPDDWSLLQWLAYWASGRHFAIWQYSQRISGILQDMHLLLQTKVLPLNRYPIDRYLTCMKTLSRILSSTLPSNDAPQGELNERISMYTQKEEERMDNILKALDYEIDGPDTIELITSKYHTERDLFPLIYLLLRRHLALIRLACDVVFDTDEMNIPTRSLENIFKAVEARVSSLETLFLQRGLHPLAVLPTFAFGMYLYVYQQYEPIYATTETKKEGDLNDISPAPVDWLRDGVHEVEPELVHDSDADPIEFEACVGDVMNGCWSGYFMNAEGEDVLGLVQFRVSDWDKDIGSFNGTGMFAKGNVVIQGNYDSTNNIIEATFATTSDAGIGDSGEDVKFTVAGTLKSIVNESNTLQSQHTISARWGDSEADLSGRLYFSQTPAWVHLLRVSLSNQYPTEAYYKPAGWRWRLAIHAAQADPESGIQEMANIQRALPPSLMRTCLWLARVGYWPSVHFDVVCSHCAEIIFGCRYLYISHRFLVSPTFCPECKQPGGREGWWTCRLDEIRIKAPQFIHQRDLEKLVLKANSVEDIVRLNYRPMSVQTPRFDLPAGFHPFSFTPYTPLSPFSTASDIQDESTSARAQTDVSSPVSSPTEDKSAFSIFHSSPSRSPPTTPPSPLSMPNPKRRVRFSVDDAARSFSPESSLPELANPNSTLSCVSCGTRLPNENGDAVWVCLVCSVVDTEELVGICARCELTNQKGTAPDLVHRHDHHLVQVRPWHNPLDVPGYDPLTPGTGEAPNNIMPPLRNDYAGYPASPASPRQTY